LGLLQHKNSIFGKLRSKSIVVYYFETCLTKCSTRNNRKCRSLSFPANFETDQMRVQGYVDGAG